MSQPDLAGMLREARPVAPPELRERVRLVAAQATPPRRQLVTWRRVLLVAVPVAIAVAAGVLRIPKAHVQEAVRRLTALGTIVSEYVSVQDLTTQVNATDRLISRLQRRLAVLRAQVQDAQAQRRLAALTARVEQLQRGRAT